MPLIYEITMKKLYLIRIKHVPFVALSLIASLLWISPAFAQCAERTKEPFRVGEKVIAAKDGPTFSIATVVSIGQVLPSGKHGNYVSLNFPDGGTGSQRTKYVAHLPARVPPCYKSGDKVVAQVDKVLWREARVIDVSDAGVTVQFVDGKRASKKFSEVVRHPTRY